MGIFSGGRWPDEKVDSLLMKMDDRGRKLILLLAGKGCGRRSARAAVDQKTPSKKDSEEFLSLGGRACYGPKN